MARMIEVLQAISYVAVDAGVCRTRLRKLNVVGAVCTAPGSLILGANFK